MWPLVGLLVTAVLVTDIVCPPVNQGTVEATTRNEVSLDAAQKMYIFYSIF